MGELVTLLDKPYLVYLSSLLTLAPLSSGHWDCFRCRGRCVAAVVELSLAYLCSELRFVVEPQYQDLNTINE
jgi:hypothetical protein